MSRAGCFALRALALLALLNCCMSLRPLARQLQAVSRTALLRMTTSPQMASHSIATTQRGDLFCTRCGQTSKANKNFQFSASCAPAAEELSAKLSAASKISETQLAAAHALELVKLSAAAKTSEADRYGKREATLVIAGVMVLGIGASLFFGIRGAEWVDRTVKSFAAGARGKARELAEARVLPITAAVIVGFSGAAGVALFELTKAGLRRMGPCLKGLVSRLLPRLPFV